MGAHKPPVFKLGAMQIYYFEMLPVGKPRQISRFVRTDAVRRFKVWEEEFKLRARLQGFTLQNGMNYMFCFPMPPSWSQKKKDRMLGTGHESKPDADNILKAIWDASSAEDQKIWHIGQVVKLWALKPAIIITRR